MSEPITVEDAFAQQIASQLGENVSTPGTETDEGLEDEDLEDFDEDEGNEDSDTANEDEDLDEEDSDSDNDSEDEENADSDSEDEGKEKDEDKSKKKKKVDAIQIPKSRFDEVNIQKNKLKQKLATVEEGFTQAVSIVDKLKTFIKENGFEEFDEVKELLKESEKIQAPAKVDSQKVIDEGSAYLKSLLDSKDIDPTETAEIIAIGKEFTGFDLKKAYAIYLNQKEKVTKVKTEITEKIKKKKDVESRSFKSLKTLKGNSTKKVDFSKITDQDEYDAAVAEQLGSIFFGK